LFDAEINRVQDWSQRVALPLIKLPKVEKNPVIIALDTESTKGLLLSIQLGVMTEDGTILKEFIPIKSASYRIPTTALWRIIKKFAKLHKIQLKSNVYLLTHWGTAELRHIDDFFDDYAVSTVSRGLHAIVEVKGHTLRFYDTSPLFTVSLEKVGESIGLAKISLDGFGEKPEKYWKEHMDEFQRDYPEKFTEYALRDVEILVKAFTQWRNWFLEKFKLDILKCVSSADIAAKIFRHYYLKQPLSRTSVESPILHVRNANGEYVPRKRTRTVFNGDLNVRKMSLLSGWGARNESLVFGRYGKPVSLFDIKASYGTMTKLQPLPVADTEWRRTTDLKEVLSSEGFAYAEFKFPSETKYPCLPVGVEGYCLLYPLEGETLCTTAELRLANELGATLKINNSYVFTPTEKETTNHPIRLYVEFFSKMKNDAKVNGDKLSEGLAKMLINSLVGKMIQRNADYSDRDLMQLRRSIGEKAFRQIYRDKTKREKYKVEGKTGALWLPECWSLITGRARTELSRFMTLGALHSVTDSCVLPATTTIPENIVAELKTVNSDFEKKPDDDGEEFWSGRTRLFAVIKNGVPRNPRRGGIPIDKESFARDVLKVNLDAGKAVVSEATQSHVVKLREALVDSKKQFGVDEDRHVKINWTWDMKRRLVNWSVNPWTDYSDTVPWKNKDQFILARMIRDAPLDDLTKQDKLDRIPDIPNVKEEAEMLFPACKRGRKSTIGKEIVGRAIALKEARPQISYRKAGQQLGISHTQVKRIWESNGVT
jgi:hypothetical protein